MTAAQKITDAIDEARERLIGARTTLVLDHIYYGALSTKLTLVESPRTKTACTDGTSIFYNRAFIEATPDAELVALVAHEVLHCALGHQWRRGDRDPGMWNEACDYAINPILKDAGFTLGADWLYDPRFTGHSAEEIYATLRDERAQQQPEPEDVENEDGDEESDDESAGDDDEETEGDEGDADGEGEGDEEGEGEGQGGGEGEGEGDDGESEIPGGVIDAPEPAESEAEWKVNVKQAQMVAMKAGSDPGDALQAVEEANKPASDCYAHIRRFVQMTAAADYSWRIPNPRYAGLGVIMPALRSESMPPIVLIIDTSGSTRGWQSKFVAEIQATVDEAQPECVWVIECDAAVHRVQRFERGEPITLEGGLRGQGGTSFYPPFKTIEDEQIQPACAIYLTDGEGAFPPLPPDYPVLWAMTGTIQAPWGESIQLERPI